MSENAPPPPPPGEGGGSTPPPPPPPPMGPGGPQVPPSSPPPPPPPGGGAGGWGSAPPPPGPGYGGPTGPSGYSVGNAFSYAWDKFKANLGPLILITLILLVAVFVVQLIGNLITSAMTGTSDMFDPDSTGAGGFFAGAMIVSLLFSALSWAVQLVIQSGIIKASLALTRGQRIDLGSAFNGINWAQVVIASVLIGIGTFVGLLLCILPGIVWIFLTWFTLYFVIDRNMSAVDAIKASINLVKDNLGPLLLFFLAAVAAYIVGACLCGVGLLAAIPIVIIAQAYTFRTLTNDPVMH